LTVNEWDKEPIEVENPYYTGYVLQCITCERWYHQWCHEPHIPDDFIDLGPQQKAWKRKSGNKKGRDWNCQSCQEAAQSKLQPIGSAKRPRVSKDSPTPPVTLDHVDLVITATESVDALHEPAVVPDESESWLCSKCLRTMPSDELVCSCPGCKSCNTGCGLPKKLGMSVTSGRIRPAPIMPEGMVPTTSMRTAEHRRNRDKIKETFHKPCARRTAPKVTELEPSTSRWQCYKCAVWMHSSDLSCMCSGCSTCVSGCGLPRHVVETAPKDSRKRRRSASE
jgi:hypothetical protein